MQTGQDSRSPEQQLRTIPAMVTAMLMGVVLFAVAATLVGHGGGMGSGAGGGGGGSAQGPAGAQGAVSPDALLLVLGVLTLAGAAGFFIFGAHAVSRARRVWERRESDEQGRAALVNTLMITTVIRAALVESFGLLGGVLILMRGDLVAWGPVALCVVLLASLLPARARLARLEQATAGMGPVGYSGERM